jgi:two-component system OmpR family response regulator
LLGVRVRVLLLEDDETLGEGLHGFLSNQGLRVDWVTSLAAARALGVDLYDLLLIDWQLPDGSGIDWLRALRRSGQRCPAIVLTARDTLNDRIHGLDSGADDYLVKPFRPEELSARIRALKRRVWAQGDSLVWLGPDLAFDLEGRALLRGGQAVDLTARELLLLEALLARQGRIVSKQDLEAMLATTAGEAQSNALQVHVFNLRKKAGHALIETIRGLGYRIAK